MTVAELSPKDAHERLDTLHVIDVRSADEYHGPLGRIPGAALMPLPEFESRTGELPQGPLLLVCRSGRRSAVACERLAALGVGFAINLAGGMIAWNRAALPVEHDDPASLSDLLDSLVGWLAHVGALTPEAAAALLREPLRRAGHSFEAPTAAAVACALDFVEESLAQTAGPPDLDLTVASYRRALAAL